MKKADPLPSDYIYLNRGGFSGACERCGKPTHEKANYCMFCGKKLVVKNRNAWEGEILFAFNDRVWIPKLCEQLKQEFPRLNPTHAEVGVAFEQIIEKEQQVLIRALGLDGKAPRINAEIGKELGFTGQTIRVRRQRALLELNFKIKNNRRDRETEEFFGANFSSRD